MNYLYLIISVVVIFFAGIRIVRPTERGLIERLGKYHNFANPGFHWIIPIIDRIFVINVTEQMVDAQPQEIITNDNLNASVDAQVYFRVKSDETSVKGSTYDVNNYKWQIVQLARTTLRNIIGTLTLKSANSERGKINTELLSTLEKETKGWGIEIIRTELKEIDPPSDVQETMNKVVKAENEKIAAIDSATAAETVADGIKRGKIKEAEGYKQAKILHAEGEAEALRLINEQLGANPALLQWRYIENLADNIQIILIPSNSPYLFDMESMIDQAGGTVITPTPTETEEPTAGD